MNQYWVEFISIALFHLIAVASPGPDFTITLKQSLRYGTRTGVYSALGIGTGILLHLFYVLIGFGLIVASHPYAYTLLTWVGAGYLIYLGYRGITSKPGNHQIKADQEVIKPTAFKAFQTGFFVNALNVKATLFFLSVYTALVSPSTPILWQVSYGCYMALATAAWFSFLAGIVGNQYVRKHIARYGYWVDRVTGVILMGLAIKLLIG